jgi:hypothetical protein
MRRRGEFRGAAVSAPIADSLWVVQNDAGRPPCPISKFTKKTSLSRSSEAFFSFMPRMGETISKEMGGYFNYYKVVEIWHREEGESGVFRACVRVEIDD